jgi:general secretion pathway protein D
MLLASVAQNRESDGRAGLPVLSGLPLVGRLFTSPRKDNTQVDIVIAVTPRVLRAPSITPEDLEMRPSGTLQMPTTGFIARLVEEAEYEEAQIAAARQAGQPQAATAAAVNPAETVTYVPAERAATTPAASGQPAQPPEFAIEVTNNRAANTPPAMQPVSVPAQPAPSPQMTVRDAVQTLVNGTAPVNTSAPAKPETKDKPQNNHATVAAPPVTNPLVELAADNALLPTVKPEAQAGPAGQLTLMLTDTAELRAGMKQRVAVMLEAGATLKTAFVVLKFDPAKLKVLSLAAGDAAPGANLLQQIDPNGKISVMLMPDGGATLKTGASILFFVEVEALGAGANALDFDRDAVRLTAADNRDAFKRFNESGLTIK